MGTGSAGSGTVTSVTATGPLSSSGGTTPNITLNPTPGVFLSSDANKNTTQVFQGGVVSSTYAAAYLILPSTTLPSNVMATGSIWDNGNGFSYSPDGSTIVNFLSSTFTASGSTFTGGSVANATTFLSTVTLNAAIGLSSSTGIGYGIGVATVSLSGKFNQVIDSSFTISGATSTTSGSSAQVTTIVAFSTRTTPAYFIQNQGDQIKVLCVEQNGAAAPTSGVERIFLDSQNNLYLCGGVSDATASDTIFVEATITLLQSGMAAVECTCWHNQGTNQPGGTCSTNVGWAGGAQTNIPFDASVTHTWSCAGRTSGAGDVNYLYGPLIHALK